MTARVIPSVFDPLNSSTLNKLREPTQPPSKKRKFEEDSAAGQLAIASIVIRVSRLSLAIQTPIVFADLLCDCIGARRFVIR